MKLSRILAAVLLVGGVLMISTAAFALPTPTCILVGDVDNFGLGGNTSLDQVPAGTIIWPGPGPSGTGYDGRSAAEKIATNGAQLTDCYSALFPAYGPNPSEIGDVIIPLPAGMKIHDGTFVMATGDFQATLGGPISMNINGTGATALNINDGFGGSSIQAFVLTPVQLAAINAAGQLDVTFDHTGSGDFIAFDWFKLCANVEPVPVPPSAILLGTGLLGLVGFRFRKNRA